MTSLKRKLAGPALGVIAVGLLAAAVGCASPKTEQAASATPQTSLSPAAVQALASPAPAAPLQQAQAPAADMKPGIVALRRINESQYRQTIADFYGTDIDVAGRFEPDTRGDGLLAVGSAALSISSGGIEQYISMARSISDQVLDEKRRGKFAQCKPASDTAPDDKCAAEFIRIEGRKLFRRPLTESEVAARVAMANAGAKQLNNYYAGLKLGLIGLLTAPEFLFRVETAENDPARPGQLRLDGYTKAQRLSFLFWNATPDEELLQAAASGAIHTDAGIKQQITRLSSSPRMEKGVRAFFVDMLQFNRFENTIKDGGTYPKYSFAIAEAAQEQTLRTLVDHLVTRNGDYRDVFTTPNTFINRPLASVYDVPYLSTEDWTAYQQPAGADHAGIVTQVAFLSMFSHPARTSPTKRGVGLHEIFLCHVMPLPADNVDFTLINDTNNGVLKTVRARLDAHASNPTCAACHTLTDPLGLALEKFDGIGQRRELENGAKIDDTAQLAGVKFTGATGLGKVLHDQADAPNCLVRNVFSYGAGRMPQNAAEQAFVRAQQKAFADNGYKMRTLMLSVASAPEFYNVVFPKPPKVDEAAKPEIASLNETSQTGAAP